MQSYVAAVSQVLAEGEPKGSLSFLITGDEEGPALHGTKRVVETLAAEGEVMIEEPPEARREPLPPFSGVAARRGERRACWAGGPR